MGDLTDESAHQIAIMDVELAPSGWGVALRHVLLDDFRWPGALHEHRSEIADKRRQNVTLRPVERVCAADGVRFLAKRPEKSANHFRLSVEIGETLLERAREPQVVVELEFLVS